VGTENEAQPHEDCPMLCERFSFKAPEMRQIRHGKHVDWRAGKWLNWLTIFLGFDIPDIIMIWNPKKTKRGLKTGAFCQRGIMFPFQNQPGFHRSW